MELDALRTLAADLRKGLNCPPSVLQLSWRSTVGSHSRHWTLVRARIFRTIGIDWQILVDDWRPTLYVIGPGIPALRWPARLGPSGNSGALRSLC